MFQTRFDQNGVPKEHHQKRTMTSSTPHLYTGLGAAAALFLTAVGAGCASVPGGIFALKAKERSPALPFVPVVQGGVLAVYGVIIGVILALQMENNKAMTEIQGYKNLAAGVCVGCSCLAAGLGMARFIDRVMMESSPPSTRPLTEATPSAQQPLIPSTTATSSNPLVIDSKMIMVMIFFESIGLYGLVVALFLSYQKE